MRYIITILILTAWTSCNVVHDLQEERFKTSVINLRQVGLFEDYKDLDDERLTKTLIEKAKKKYQIDGHDKFNEIFDPVNTDYFDLHVAELDEKRVWCRDLESDILNGNNVYAETVKQFGILSGGFLNPDQIKEQWPSDSGLVKVSFQDKDTLRVFHLEHNDGWYSPNFFEYLESSMKGNGSPYQFYTHDKTGQDVFIIRLTQDEKEKIEKKMNWKLVKF